MTKSTPLSELPKMGNSDVAQNRQNQIPSLPLPVNTSLGNDINEDNDDTIMEALRQLPGADQNVGMVKPPTTLNYHNHENTTQHMPPQMAMPLRPQPSQSQSQGQGQAMRPQTNPNQLPYPPNQGNQGNQGNGMRPQTNPTQMPYPPNQGISRHPVDEMELDQDVGLNKSYDRIPKPISRRDSKEGYHDSDEVESHYDDDINQNKQNILKRGFSDVFNHYSEIKHVVIVMIVFIIMTFIPIELLAAKYIDFDKFPYAAIVIKAVFAGALYFSIVKLL